MVDYINIWSTMVVYVVEYGYMDYQDYMGICIYKHSMVDDQYENQSC